MQPNPLAIVLLCFAGAAGLIFLLWLNHKWMTRHERMEQAPRRATPRSPRAVSYAVSYILGGAGPVSTSQDDAPVVMSRDADDGSRDEPSAVQTDGRQTDRRGAAPAFDRDIMLDICKRLRKLGMPREEARAMLRALGYPLDNNLWSQAAPPPPEDEPTITPIAKRPTNAQFHDDPELEYKPLR